jgi:NAD(P)-dependent dehydrogenase (short-subunit alcohol dehydrogenase family)
MSNLNGKVAVITGGSSGIGLAAARRFVDEGAYVFITGRRQSELDRATAIIGRNVTAIAGDVAKLSDLDRLYATVVAEKKRIDILVANAGAVELLHLPDVTEAHFDHTFSVNARGTFFTVQKALPFLNDGASIVLVSSILHFKGFADYTVYGASKAAVRSFARSWSMELKDRGIRVNCVSPGVTDTPILVGLYKEGAEAAKDAMSQLAPLGRVGPPDELANAIFFLASDEGSYVNGIDLVVDGGLSQV